MAKMTLAKIGATSVAVLLVLVISIWAFRSGKFSPQAATTSPPPIVFADVSSSYWAYKEIQAVVQRGWMTGTLKSTRYYFLPSQNITRAELAVIMAKITNNYYDNPTPSFIDVPKTYKYYKEIEGCKRADIVWGYGDGTYRPDQKATRAELAVMIFRAKNLTQVAKANDDDLLSDVGKSYWAYKEIEADWNAGYLNACETGDGTNYPKFCPDRLLTRAETAYFIYNPFIGYLTPSLSDYFTNLNNSRVLYTNANLESGEINLKPSNTDYSDPSATHAPLTVLGLNEWRNYSISVKMKTLDQLRPSNPNSWEVGWIFFRYKDPMNFYYFIHKPVTPQNGPIEIGKVINGQQTILPIYWIYGVDVPPINISEQAAFRIYKINIMDMGNTGKCALKTSIQVYIDGIMVVDDCFDSKIQAGKVGLYDEDARVHFDDLSIAPL